MLETMLCDVLAGEQGPCCYSLKQLPNLKVIHVRFIEGKVQDAPVEVLCERRKRKIDDISEGDNAEHGKAAVAVASLPQRVSSQSPSKFAPRSLSVVDMLRLGKLIPNTITSVEMFNFDKSVMVWTGRPTAVEFSIESKPFAAGGFRLLVVFLLSFVLSFSLSFHSFIHSFNGIHQMIEQMNSLLIDQLWSTMFCVVMLLVSLLQPQMTTELIKSRRLSNSFNNLDFFGNTWYR